MKFVERESILKYSLCDLNLFMVERGHQQTGTGKSFPSLSELESYMRVEKRAHVASVKKPYPSFNVDTAFYVKVGRKDNDDDTWLVSDVYSSVGDEFQYSDLLTWLRQKIGKSGYLKPVCTNKGMIEIHADWSSSSHYIAVRKHTSKIIEHRYDFRVLDWRSRYRFATWIEGHDWGFHYTDDETLDHFYAGDLDIIHSELLRIATDAYPIHGYENLLDRVNALKALSLFYSQYPRFTSKLNEQHVANSIIDAISPHPNMALREAASKLLKHIDRQFVVDRLRFIVKTYKKQIKDLEGFMDEYLVTFIVLDEKERLHD